MAQVFRNRLAEGSPYPKLQSNTSSYVQSDADNNYLWNWVAPYYGGWDSIPENILEAYDTYTCTGLSPAPSPTPASRPSARRLTLSPTMRRRTPISLSPTLPVTTTTPAPTQTTRKNCDEAAKVNKNLK